MLSKGNRKHKTSIYQHTQKQCSSVILKHWKSINNYNIEKHFITGGSNLQISLKLKTNSPVHPFPITPLCCSGFLFLLFMVSCNGYLAKSQTHQAGLHRQHTVPPSNHTNQAAMQVLASLITSLKWLCLCACACIWLFVSTCFLFFFYLYNYQQNSFWIL